MELKKISMVASFLLVSTMIISFAKEAVTQPENRSTDVFGQENIISGSNVC